MNKPSQYNIYWKKLQQDKKLTVETTVPARVRKAIMKRKHVLGGTGRLKFMLEMKLDEEKKMVIDHVTGNAVYFLHIIYNPFSSQKQKELGDI